MLGMSGRLTGISAGGRGARCRAGRLSCIGATAIRSTCDGSLELNNCRLRVFCVLFVPFGADLDPRGDGTTEGNAIGQR